MIKYTTLTNDFNSGQVSKKDNDTWVRESNRKIKTVLNNLFSTYAYYDHSTYKLSSINITGYLVWLKIINTELYNNILYDTPIPILKLIKTPEEYRNDIIDYQQDILCNNIKLHRGAWGVQDGGHGGVLKRYEELEAIGDLVSNIIRAKYILP
tara:strand:- start:288 stop:746 length:459 start_codon:yes stop_codon:yes gene_type:complete